jgi:hypothetical protein
MKHAACLLLAALIALPVAGQDDSRDDPNWYRVELIIFANREPQAAESETWPLLPALSYPDEWQVLSQGNTSILADRELILVPLENQLPEPGFELAWDKSVDQLLREQRRMDLYRQPRVHTESLFDLEIPKAMTSLDAEEREFASERKRLDWRDNIDVLFHESWLQPVQDRQDSTPLVIDGTPRAGDYPELQGTILLYSGRYLHIETALWLNTDGSYLDNDWTMPRPPLPVEPPEALAMESFAVAPPWNWLGEIQTSADPAEDELQPIVLSGPVTSGRMTEASLEYIEIPEDIAVIDPEAPPPLSKEDLQAFLSEPEYDFRHAVLVQQKRRMRSGELHYIDHPLVGILIKVSRYEFEPFVAPDPEQAIAGTP